ncbi:hypothetical protein KORDIASMS9_01429 [Kordia sp. SMS9]|uniref:hypothetical protein n=1 Tax=Kordia sp. SMS9 TaxID=2282170 RepID=UPI000E1080BE|nr:hypothetical protein [Kordia sp. SMS9]AXG69209.1 hypothetical protein KORDIASMS9_01429 [Kordia sp. SMS9]
MKKYIYSICIPLFLVSCSEIIEVPDITNDTVNLIAPADDAIVNITTFTLSWETVENAESYQVQVARPDFENIIQLELDTTILENSISIDVEAGNSYQWRVRAKNSDYTTAYTTYSFTTDVTEVQDITNSTVNLIAPADTITLNLTTFTLSWEAVENAENYHVQIARPDFQNIIQLELDTTVPENSISVELEAGNSYQWRVRAENSGYATPYATYSFTIE